MNYRATPLNNGKSPSQWLFGYNIRTLLPMTRPGKEVPYATARPKNFGRRRLRLLETGEIVRMRDIADTCWKHKAKVIKLVAPHSYNVLRQDGRVFRRNRHHLLPTKESFAVSDEIDYAVPLQTPSEEPEPTPLTAPVSTESEERPAARPNRTVCLPRRFEDFIM